jgi:hypothetical protein
MDIKYGFTDTQRKWSAHSTMSDPWIDPGKVVLEFMWSICLYKYVEHVKHTGRCVNAVRLSENGVRAFQKDQQNLHKCVPSWPQRCSDNICKRNLFCGHALYTRKRAYYSHVDWFINIWFNISVLHYYKCYFSVSHYLKLSQNHCLRKSADSVGHVAKE